MAEEQELRDLFERFGRVTRVFLARDRETQRAKGFAFISYADRSDAVRACEKLDGCTCNHPLQGSYGTKQANSSFLLQSVTATSFFASSSPSDLLRFVSSSLLFFLFHDISGWILLFLFTGGPSFWLKLFSFVLYD